METVKSNIISIRNIIITSKTCDQLIELYNYFEENKELNYENFNDILKKILQNNNHNIFLYIDDINNILGAITLLTEQKFIHNGKCVAHIEDFVVKKEYRSQNIGKDLMNYAINYAKQNNCYKIILDTDTKLVNYYSNYGFVNKGVYMGYYF
jgi:glucosamine-phosphate N-acetyltransferase